MEVEAVKSADEELLALLARQARRLPLPVFIVLCLVAGVIYPYSQPWGWSIWLGCVLVVLALRYYVLGILPELEQYSTSRRINVAALLSGLNGAVHSISLWYFPYMTDVERAIQSLVLAGLGTAAVATTGGNRKVYLAYFVFIFPPIVLLWATYGTTSFAIGSGFGLALSVVVFATVLVLLARDTERQFHESVQFRQEQAVLNRQLAGALHDAEVADRAKTRFLAAASHDLRQPIHALSLFSAALRMQPLDPSAKELANNIDESATVLASQLDALLDISKLDAGVIEPEFDVIDLTAMLERIGREYESEALDAGLDLVIRVEAGLQVVSDRLLLERIIRNLVNNAIRYTDDGRVLLECRQVEDRICLAIEDTGIGIPVEEQRRIFGEFYQVSREDIASRQGLGLGLSIVTRLCELLDADLQLKSVPDEGTRIEIALLPERDRQEAIQTVTTSIEGISALVIDDARAVRLGMAALLQSRGAESCLAASISEALDVLEQFQPDILISDLKLAGESGIAAVERVRERLPGLPAIIITADTGAEEIREAHASGLAVLHKPVDIVELELRVMEAIQHGAGVVHRDAETL